MCGHCDTLCPAELIGQHNNPRAGGRAAAIRGLLQYATAHVLPWHPSFTVVADRTQLTSVQ
jgi:hypothetical protein